MIRQESTRQELTRINHYPGHRFKPTRKEIDDSEKTWDDNPAGDDSVAAEPGLLGTRCRLDSKLPEDSRSCSRDAGREVI